MNFIKLIILTTLTCIIDTSYGQVPGFKKDNVLLPEKLIMSEHVLFDTIYSYPLDSFRKTTKPFFEIQKYIDYTKLLSEKAINGNVIVHDASQYSEFYPYSTLDYGKELDVNQILKNLGQDTFKIIDFDSTNVERQVIKEINFDELGSINFIEDWALSVEPLSFRKNVYAIEPIRRYSNEMSDNIDEYYYRRVFRFYNPQTFDSDKSRLKLIAKVKYEDFFNLNGSYFGNNYGKLIEMYFFQNDKNFEYNWITNSENTPFFNNFNQLIFIKTLLNQVFEGKAKATDFNNSQVLTPEEARNRVFEKVTVNVTNVDTWQEEARTVENDYTSEIHSVIFIEEWYYNEVNMQIVKKVTGIAPVRYYYDNSNEENILKRKILFTIQL